MLCINKRLYRSDRTNRSNRNLFLQDTGSAVSLFHTATGGEERYSADL